MLSAKYSDFTVNKSTKIMLFNQSGLVESLSNEEIHTFSDLTYKFLFRNIKEESVCLGLLMGHNLYIPSIILSIRKLNVSFIFLKENVENSVKQLNINWILSFQSTVDNFLVQDCLNTPKTVLFLHKNTNFLSNNINYENILCVMESSGTTGVPKFIKIENKCIESNVDSLREKWDIKETDVVFFGTPLTFDPSLIELLLAFLTGASLVVVSNKTRINPNALFTALFRHGSITVLQIVPSVFLRWNPTQIGAILGSKLRILAFGGEQFPFTLLNYPRKGVRIFNLYGITEISCWATIAEVTEEVSLGEGLTDTTVELRDENGVQTDGEGEIFIGSTSRFCHILGEEQEKVAFRATGDLGKITEKGLVYLGRKNDVIKRFGHRVCLTKIQGSIENQTGLQNKMIYFSNKLLIFFVANYDTTTKAKIIDKLRVKLLHTLPAEAFPDFIDLIPKLPLTSHGKIDSRSLEQVYLSHQKKPADPRTFFRGLWLKYLGISGEDSNFFELGGNSISAIQLLAEFRDGLNADFFDLTANLFEKTLQDCLDCLWNTRPKPDRNPENHAVTKIGNTRPLKVDWKYDFKACVDSTAIFFNHKGLNLVALGSFSRIFSVLNACNGEEVASVTLPEAIESSPCLSPCKNYLLVGCFDGKFYCIDYFNREIEWFYQTGDRIKNAACLYQNSVVFGSYDKHLYCLSLDGKLCWKLYLKAGIVSSPIPCNSKLYTATILGFCSCISNGTVIWSYSCHQPIFGSGCITKTAVIWPDVTGIVHGICLDTGVELWHFTATSQIYSSLLQKDNTIIFGCHDHNLYIVDVSGKPQIRFLVGLNSAISSTPCLINAGIAIATNSGDLYTVCLEKGAVLGHLRLGGEVFSSPCYGEGALFLGCRDNFFYCIQE